MHQKWQNKWFHLNYKEKWFGNCLFLRVQFLSSVEYHFSTWLYKKKLWYCKYVGMHWVTGNWWFHQSTDHIKSILKNVWDLYVFKNTCINAFIHVYLNYSTYGLEIPIGKFWHTHDTEFKRTWLSLYLIRF